MRVNASVVTIPANANGAAITARTSASVTTSIAVHSWPPGIGITSDSRWEIGNATAKRPAHRARSRVLRAGGKRSGATNTATAPAAAPSIATEIATNDR